MVRFWGIVPSRSLAARASVTAAVLVVGCAKPVAPPAHPAVSASEAAMPNTHVLKLQDLTFPEVDKLDRKTAVFFLTFGNLEVHGPALPIGSDYFQAVRVRDAVVAKLAAAHPDRQYVVVPVVPLGEGGAEDVAGKADHIGTFHVRYETLRNVAIDLGAAIARKGFQNILLIHAHGGPLHNVAFTEAAAFVSEKYGARMVNLTSIVFAEGYFNPKIMEQYLGPGWEKRIGFEGHAGAAETSMNLFLNADLVKPDYKRLPPFVAKDLAEFAQTSERPDWNGYWGAPAEGSKALGKALFDDVVQRTTSLAERSLAGEDLSKLPTHGEHLPPPFERIEEQVQQRYDAQAAEIDAWVKRRHQQR
jgi:creatinine amidohydrolase/Fe(II)-dependent formamide hydrolase-like protein